MARLTLLLLSALALVPSFSIATVAVDPATTVAAPHSRLGRKAKHFGTANSNTLNYHYSHPKATGLPDAPIKVGYQYSAPPGDYPGSRRPHHHPHHETSCVKSSQTTSTTASMSPAPSTTSEQISTTETPTTTTTTLSTVTSSNAYATPSIATTTTTTTTVSEAPSSSSTTESTASTSSSTSSSTAQSSSTTTTTTPAPTTTQAPTTTTTTQAETTTTTTTTTSAAAPTPTSSDLEAISLAAHNELRAAHNAAPLTWNTDLAAAAQSWADTCLFQHGGGVALGAGENIAAYSGAESNVAYAISMWSSEASLYDYNKPGYNDTTGHFTQMVWKGTTQIGCAEKYCTPVRDPNGAWAWDGFYYVCEYLAAGNIVGMNANETAQYFRDNVEE